MKMCVVGVEREGEFIKMASIYYFIFYILSTADQSVKCIYWAHSRSLEQFFPTVFLL